MPINPTQLVEAIEQLSSGAPSESALLALETFNGWGAYANLFAARSGELFNLQQRLIDAIGTDDYTQASASINDSYYTPTTLVKQIWQLAVDLGFTGGSVLDLGCGTARFGRYAPAELRGLDYLGVDMDGTALRIANALSSNIRTKAADLSVTNIKSNSIDLCIGNVPFGQERVYDPNFEERFNLHTYFLARSVMALRPGGFIIAITSRYFLDSLDASSRLAIGQLGGEFVGAVRLPSSTFQDSGAGVVSDVIVFRKRVAGEPISDERWGDVAKFGATSAKINRYFVDNPGHVGGKLVDATDRYGAISLDVIGTGNDVSSALGTACTTMTTEGYKWTPYAGEVGSLDDVILSDAEGNLEGTYLIRNDLIHQVRDGLLVPLAKQSKELRRLIEIRDCAMNLLTLEEDLSITDAAIAPRRAILNDRYDEYVKEFGFINRATIVEGPADPETGVPAISRRRPPMGNIRQDPDYPLLLALEDYDDSAATATKAAIFNRRLNTVPDWPNHVDSAADALVVSLNKTATVDMALMADLTGLTISQLAIELESQIVYDPIRQEWETVDAYYSGDVRSKYQALNAFVKTNSRLDMRDQLERLRSVVPADLGPDDIIGRLGSPWIDADDVTAFADEILGAKPRISHEAITAAWAVEINDWARKTPEAASRGTAEKDAFALMELALNNQSPVVYREEWRDGAPVSVRDNDATQAAELAQEALQAEFNDWLWTDPDRCDRLVELYNRLYNSSIARTYDGSHLQFPGMCEDFKPYPWQLDAVWQQVQTPAALCGLPVGAGKSWIIAATAIKLKQLGLTEKTMAIVPGHILEQVASATRQYFPRARVLMATKEDMSKKGRKLFAARVATQEWDLVLMTHSAFGLLPLHPRTQSRFIDETIFQYRTSMDSAQDSGNTFARRRLERSVRQLVQRQRALLDQQRDSDGVYFEQLGISTILVDEAHLFKNLGMPCRQDGFTLSASKRATDLVMKLDYLRERNDGRRWGSFFTATPISNTLSESYVLMRYLIPHRLRDLRLQSFDAFAANFIEFVTAVEVSPDGATFRSKRRPSKFTNCTELRRIIGEFADLRTADSLGLPRPAAKRYIVTSKPTPELGAYVNSLVERCDLLREGRPMQHADGRPDNHLWVVTDGRRAAVDPTLAGVKGAAPKIDALVENILKHWETSPRVGAKVIPIIGAQSLFDYLASNEQSNSQGDNETYDLQVVFCDIGTPNAKSTQTYGKIRSALVAAGMPANLIRFVHDAKAGPQTQQLHSDCRAGKVAVLLGSSSKLGIGANIQNRLIAIHHYDAPWRPAEIEQREGRGLRPGNSHGTVQIYRYCTEKTFDSYSWQTLERKARFIAQFMDGSLESRVVEDIGDSVLSYAEVKAAATGNPIVMELAQAQADVVRLAAQARSHERKLIQRYRSIQTLRSEEEFLAEQTERLAALNQRVSSWTPEGNEQHDLSSLPSPAVDKKLGFAVNELLQSARSWTRFRYSGLEIVFGFHDTLNGRVIRATISDRDTNWSQSIDIGRSWANDGQTWRIRSVIAKEVADLPAKEANFSVRLAKVSNRRRQFEETEESAFEFAGELDAARQRVSDLHAEIDALVAEAKPAA